MPRYEFRCLKCLGITIFFLNDGDSMNLATARCEFCFSKKIQIEQFNQNVADVIAALQEQIEEMSEKINALENGDEPDQTLERKH